MSPRTRNPCGPTIRRPSCRPARGHVSGADGSRQRRCRHPLVTVARALLLDRLRPSSKPRLRTRASVCCGLRVAVGTLVIHGREDVKPVVAP